MTKSFVLKASNISCDYSQDGDVTKGIVVDKVQIPSVGITVIVGPSGSGKSTLLSLLSGIRKPTSEAEGCLLKFYASQSEDEIDLLASNTIGKANLGFVFQEPHLIKEISGRSNAEIVAQLLGRKNNVVNVDKLANDFDVRQVVEQRADTLSGGQAQRIAIVRALAVNPDILVCDEPTSSLDEDTGMNLLNSISEWAHSNGKAVLWVTHNLQQAAKYSDYLIKVAGGELDVNPDGSPHDLRKKTYNQKLGILRGAKTTGGASPKPKKIISELFEGRDLDRAETSWGSFILRIVIEYFYLGTNQSLEVSNSFKLFRKRWWAPFLKTNLIALIALGILVFSMLLKVQNTGSVYFKEQLSKPEVSHFTVEGELFKLSRDGIGSLKTSFKKIENAVGGPIIFPRRERTMKDIIPSSVGNCDKYNPSSPGLAARPLVASLLTFDQNEPLYKNLVSMVPSEKALASTLFATNDLLWLFPDKRPNYLCLDIDGDYVPFKILWMNKKARIPGGSDRTFFMGITETAFRKASKETQSTNYRYTLYDNVAIYFNEDNRDDIMCKIRTSEKCRVNKIFPVGNKPGMFKVNDDVFAQIDQFSTISYLAQRAILVLVGSFILVMASALGFAMSAEVKAQEKSLAILRAFGVSGRKVASIFQLRTFIQLAYATVIAGIGFWVLKVYLESIISDQPWAIGLNLTLGISDLLVPVVLTLAITQFVTISVVLIWSQNNRYVAEKLQGL